MKFLERFFEPIRSDATGIVIWEFFVATITIINFFVIPMKIFLQNHRSEHSTIEDYIWPGIL